MTKAKGRGRPPIQKAEVTGVISTSDSRSKSKSGGNKSRLRNEEDVVEQIQGAKVDLTEEVRSVSDRSEASSNPIEIEEMLVGMNTGDPMAVAGDKSVKEAMKKPWVDVIRGNRQVRRGVAMDFEAPSIVDGEAEVEIRAEDVESEIEFWSTGLIFFAVGRELTMNAVKVFMAKVWNFVALPDLYYHEQGYFLVRFKTREDREAVLRNGPYSIFSSPVFICKWTSDFVLKDDLLRMMPIWVTFPNLALHLWGERSLSKIASAIGRPISTDECTAKKLRISYARVLVEVDITRERKQEVKIKNVDGNIIMQKVVYEGVPAFCPKCQKIGHNCDKKEVIKSVWVAKENDKKKIDSEAVKLIGERGKMGEGDDGPSKVKGVKDSSNNPKGIDKGKNHHDSKGGDNGRSVKNASQGLLAESGSERPYDKLP